ncbi:MAG: hypothetical protein JWO89_2539 [Verrucomicrobiaceae bacterium]|nr:hypothetical protein [Verrucomicrobiaceae bacterium]MDB6120601.1 hypothetical protein [Verrucomicrobiaceae bacterium]
MNPENSILMGLPVNTVAEIADCAGTLKRVAQARPDGKITGQLVRGESHVVQGFDGSFNSEEMAMAHMDNLVTACVAWRDSHEPACMADAGFAC